MRRFRQVGTIDRPASGPRARKARYGVRWTDDSGKQRCRFFRTRQERSRARATIENDVNGWILGVGGRAFVDAVAEYQQAQLGRSLIHQARVERTLRRFREACRPRALVDLSAAAVDRFLSLRAESGGVRPITIRDERSTLHAFAEWAIRRGYMAQNPVKATATIRVPHRVPRPPRPEDWVRLLRVIGRGESVVDDPQAWHILVLLAVTSGFRRAVLLNCYVGVDLADERAMAALAARHSRSGGFSVLTLPEEGDQVGLLFTLSGKTGQENVSAIPLVVADRVKARVAAVKAHRRLVMVGIRPAGLDPGGDRLFPWLKWPRKAWASLARHAGIAWSFRALRAAAGTQAAVARAQRAGQVALEHSHLRTTREHYLDPEVVARAVAIGMVLPELPPLPAFGVRRCRRWSSLRLARCTAPKTA